MSQWQGPRWARPNEFSEAMRFTDTVFRPGQSGRRIVQRQYPHAYRDQPSFARRLLLLRDQGELVGCLAVHPIVLRLGSARVTAGGIGVVGTHPERRGEGIMSCLLNDAIQRMRLAGHAVSVLGGDRQRYGRFGWENAGVRMVYHVTARSLAAAGEIPRVRVRRWPRGPSAALLRRIREISAARPFGVERRTADFVPLIERVGKTGWYCEAEGAFAYAVSGGPSRAARPITAVHEMGGDPQLCRVLLHWLVQRTESGVLSVIAGPNPDEEQLLTPNSATWIRLADGMVSMLNLPRLIAQLTPELRRRARQQGTSGRFELSITRVDGSSATATLDLGGRGRHRIRLGQRELIELLFGTQPADERFASHCGLSASGLGSLEAILPLPLHIPSLNHI